MITATPSPVRRRSERILQPAGVFALVVGVHFVWLGLFPERDPAQNRWLCVASAERTSWLARYIESQSYWLGLSYGLSLAFAVAAFRRYRERQLCAARNLAIGGVTLSGVLAVAGCFLLGCCGSPMLVVYLNLFGAAFLPFAKPLVAGLTATSLAAGWCWMRRQERLLAATTVSAANDARCECR